LLLLHTGARVTEIAQLAVEDVVTKDGVVCIEIRAGIPGQTLKNKASERVVPVHSSLLKLGFEEFVQSRRDAGAVWLMPNVEPGKKGQTMGSNMSGWWSRWWRKFDGITPRTSLHSLRHGVSQELTGTKGVENVEVKQLLGHSDVSTTTGTYGTRLSVRQLATAIETLDFRCEIDAIR
jgi:integrase